MHLVRVQVPDFRVLKNVDITFEKEFSPKIFPLGSQNGGGKSTLLQLIFVLLHCSPYPEKMDFLKNLLGGFKIPNDSTKRGLAIIEIWDGQQIVKIDFFAQKNSYIKEILTLNPQLKENNAYIEYSAYSKLDKVKNRISILEERIVILEKALTKLENIKNIEKDEDRIFRLNEEIEYLRELGLRIPFQRSIRMRRTSLEEIQEEIRGTLEVDQLNLKKLEEDREQLEASWEKIKTYLRSENLIYICNYSSNGGSNEENALLCHIEGINFTEAEEFLKDLSQKIFLAAPSTQVFIFLSPESRKLLFAEPKGENDLYSEFKDAKSKLPGFFTYDFLAVDILIASFKAARDLDFREAIEKGEYGNSYKNLVNDLNLMLVNKKINLDANLSGVTFKLENNGENIELYPEDLSHGELKRLSIYMWIKYRSIENAIVLMDEIEIAFHPDWQYLIISDLAQWSPSNQYILATHSYELCQALTPAHVKELEPKLLKQKAQN